MGNNMGWRHPRPAATGGIVLLLAVIFISVGGGCGRRLPPNPVNVLLITLDTCRPDMLSCYEEEGSALTPRLDEMATEGVLFERAFCQSPTTLPSHASILTGLSPLGHGMHDNGVYFLGEEFVTLAEALADRGYHTAAFVSAFVLDHRFGLDQGFSLYDDRMEEALKPGEVPRFRPDTDPVISWWISRRFEPYQRRADEVAGAALAWLTGKAKEPFFLWIHFFDPHEPYTPPPDFVERYDPGYRGPMTGQREDFVAALREGKATEADLDHMVARYRGEITFTDEWAGRLLDGVREEGLMDRTLILVAGDHGEGLGEHHFYFEHNALIYDELVRVPLLIRFPGGEHDGMRIARPVRTIDILPTVTEYLEVATPAGVEGRSLMPLVRGEEEKQREIYLEALCSRQALPVPVERRGLRTPRWKFIRTTERADSSATLELYDLAEDPWELVNLAGSDDSLAAYCRRRLDEVLAAAPASAAAPLHARELDQETREKLRALGYVR